MPISILTDEQLRRYRSLRREGVAATHAYRSAIAARPMLPYRTGPGTAIQFDLTDRPELASYVTTAVSEPDPESDVSWLGTFTDTACPEAIEVNPHDSRFYRYFVPTYTVAQRRAELSAHGYARGVAQVLAEQEHAQHTVAACLDALDKSGDGDGDGDGDRGLEVSGDEQPWIDVDSTEGAAIVSLFRRLKDLEEPDGSWPGGLPVAHAEING